ncbi:type IV pilus modification protein PilV [Neisseria weaveri]|uniref:type IV pilus modification protein PilV n=1 Tax=Neisseria weaveri TaxID=28091 RepID=UPI00022326B8|nr:type IV pilus modification protein PilV [Neisseria weaveri]EGV34810.1 hypothetical protein l13_20710 [Neisseria weaveri ATCC 51223]SAY50742.1 type IV pilus assembly protein PilV [Neisseria weaveri]
MDFNKENRCFPIAVIREGRLKTQQQGMTLLEILIAMFVLTVGVLALLATQLQTVVAVREAEGQTIVAQAAQNLIEGMAINPVLCKKSISSCEKVMLADDSDDLIRRRNDVNDSPHLQGSGKEYPASYRQFGITTISNNNKTCSKNPKCQPISDMNKRQLLELHLARFEDTLSRGLPEATIFYVICNDTSGVKPSIVNNAMIPNCKGGNTDPLTIKVAWQQNVERSDGSGKMVHSYQVRVAE